MEEKKKSFHVRVSYVYIYTKWKKKKSCFMFVCHMYIYIYIYNLIVITGKRDLICKCLVVNMDKLQKFSTLI